MLKLKIISITVFDKEDYSKTYTNINLSLEELYQDVRDYLADQGVNIETDKSIMQNLKQEMSSRYWLYANFT